MGSDLFHFNQETKTIGKCKAEKGGCPFQDASDPGNGHYGSEEEIYEYIERVSEKEDRGDLTGDNTEGLVMKRGELVKEGKIALGEFCKKFNKPDSMQGYYEGTEEELSQLIKDNFHKAIPGTGSVDGDVVLVPLPPKGFVNSIVKITPENEHLLSYREEPRMEGEKPVRTAVFESMTKIPAKNALAVVYRADTLGRDNNRTTDAEYEIVAILAQEEEGVIPMHPNEMERNSKQEEGGTYREYTEKEWADARDYWSKHAYATRPRPIASKALPAGPFIPARGDKPAISYEEYYKNTEKKHFAEINKETGEIDYSFLRQPGSQFDPEQATNLKELLENTEKTRGSIEGDDREELIKLGADPKSFAPGYRYVRSPIGGYLGVSNSIGLDDSEEISIHEKVPGSNIISLVHERPEKPRTDFSVLIFKDRSLMSPDNPGEREDALVTAHPGLPSIPNLERSKLKTREEKDAFDRNYHEDLKAIIREKGKLTVGDVRKLKGGRDFNLNISLK